MKQLVKWGMAMAVVAVIASAANAQKIDEERMERDIEIAENVLGTLIKQKLEKRTLFPFEVEGKYMAGYGVTFRLPGDFNTNWIIVTEDIKGAVMPGHQDSYTYTYKNECDDCEREMARTSSRVQKTNNRDSLLAIYNQRLIEASKEFLVDYGDLISQLSAEERISITNRGDSQHGWYGVSIRSPKRSLITVETTKGEMAAVRQGKTTREQALQKIKVVNTTTVDAMDPDLELFTSIFNRLYKEDLSKTYYINEGLYYERMKDFGALFYMNVYSSTETDYRKFRMPTQDLENLDRAARDKKVTELYPEFEKGIKENLLDYGRTLKSLKDNEVLTLNVKITKCEACGIPSTIEVTVKADVLRQYGTGQLSKEAAMAKVLVKKGAPQ